MTQFRTLFAQSLTAVAGDAEGLVTLPIVSGPARGFRMKLDLFSAEGSFWLGRYERPIAARLALLCQVGWNVWDCGAHIGYYTLVFSRRVGSTGKVVAFEPDPNNFQRVDQNLRLNNLQNAVVVQTAIGSPTGEAMFVSLRQQTSHLVNTYVGTRALENKECPSPESLVRVRCLGLDQLLEQFPAPHLVKLDIEGAEALALVHANKLATETRPRLIIELHNPDCEEAVRDFCHRYQYQLLDLLNDRRIEDGEWGISPVLCVPE